MRERDGSELLSRSVGKCVTSGRSLACLSTRTAAKMEAPDVQPQAASRVSISMSRVRLRGCDADTGVRVVGRILVLRCH